MDRRYHCKLRNQATKLNHTKKKIYFRERIHTSTNDSKKYKKTNDINDVKKVRVFSKACRERWLFYKAV